MLSQSIQ